MSIKFNESTIKTSKNTQDPNYIPDDQEVSYQSSDVEDESKSDEVSSLILCFSAKDLSFLTFFSGDQLGPFRSSKTNFLIPL